MDAHGQPTLRARLAAIEGENDVSILFAVEAGSRAWGFASPDSDYDVRFIYTHRRDWYLRLEPQREVIDSSIEGDVAVSGWDLRKALRLMLKANPALLECLDSPIAYREAPRVRAEFRALAAAYFRPAPCWHRYHSIARANFWNHLQGPRVTLYRYFHVLRSLLACRWIGAGRGPAPMLFSALVSASSLDAPVRTALEELRARKAAGHELCDVPRVAVLNDFIEQELARHELVREHLPTRSRPDSGPADAFFLRWLAVADPSVESPHSTWEASWMEHRPGGIAGIERGDTQLPDTEVMWAQELPKRRPQ